MCEMQGVMTSEDRAKFIELDSPAVIYAGNDLISKQVVINAIHNYFIDRIEATEPISVDGYENCYDLKVVQPLLVMNKELSAIIRSLDSH